MSHSTAPTTLRLTARGRLVLTLLVALSVVTGSLLLAGPRADAGATGGEATVYTVMAGETLWEIAGELAPEEDPRMVIDRIMRMNNLSSAVVLPGDQLVVPPSF